MKSFSILFTIPNFITAGSGRVMLNIIERLDSKKIKPAVAVLKKGGALDADIDRMGIPFIEAPFTLPPKPYRSLPFRAWRAAKPFREFKADIWHSFHYLDDYTEPIVARMSGAKAWVYTKKSMSWGSRAWLLRSYFANRIVADNTDMLNNMFNRFGLKRKVHYIPHSVPTHIYHPNVLHEHNLRDKFHVDSGSLMIGCVAHLVPVKGHLTLVKAMSYLERSHLFIAGKPVDKNYSANLYKTVKQINLEDKITFFNNLNNIAAFLNEIDIFVLPTWGKWRQEGCPVALIEAMACGKACISTDIPGARDLIEHGKSGLLIPPEDEIAMAGAIRKITENFELREKLGVAAQRRVEQFYRIEREVADHEKLYLDLIR